MEKGGAHVALYWISSESEMRQTVSKEILKLSLYVALISAGGMEQEILILLSLLSSVIDIFKIVGQR